MTDAHEVLALYDAEMRADPPPETGVRYERAGAIVRAIGRQPRIVFSKLNETDADGAIAGEVAWSRRAGGRLEWKVYGHDRPADLGRRLAAAGFAADEPETLMAIDLAAPAPRRTPPRGIEIRRVADAAGLADMAAVSGAAFGRDDAWKIEAFGARLADPSLGLYVAYAGGRPVSEGRLELPRGRSFAALWGGGTAPAYRGQGIYGALVAARAADARRRGYRYLAVDARDRTSRPILARLGFRALSSIRAWTLGARP